MQMNYDRFLEIIPLVNVKNAMFVERTVPVVIIKMKYIIISGLLLTKIVVVRRWNVL